MRHLPANPDMSDTETKPPEQAASPILVWDYPVRVFHWLLVPSFFIALLTGDSDRWRDVHVFTGYLILGLLVFRISWGFIGNRYARFRSFLFGPAQVVSYVNRLAKGKGERHIGHNPAGSWAIYTLIGLGLLISVTGWIVLGTEESQGLFKGLRDSALGESLKGLHEWAAWAMLILACLHITGVVVESIIHHENLAKSMITGLKDGTAPEAATSAYPLIGILLLAAALAGGVYFFRDKIFESPDRPYLPFVGKALPDLPLWRTECASCHVAFHPTLLPARSWKKMLAEQDKHFGEALGLDANVIAEISAFLEKNAAETGMTEAAFKINRSIPATMTPLRVTETGYWLEKHHEIPEALWIHPKVGSKSNCSGCHLDAEQGTYEDAAMRLPK